MVLTARLALTSTSTPTVGMQSARSSVIETYQKALKLIQDPILPVRAHGLFLLRDLVTSVSSSPASSSDLGPLIPAILDIFIQSVQDDDSYIFLNAVQGLSTLVASSGKKILKPLVALYTKGIDGLDKALSRPEVDKRLRIGEALGQVIRHCGSTLPDYCEPYVFMTHIHR